MTQRIIDLSQEIYTGMPIFPLHAPTMILPWAKREVYGFKTETLFLSTHAGTHVDAPSHFLADGSTIDEEPLDLFMGEAVLFDFSDLPPKSLIGRAELEEAHAQTPLQPGDGLLVRTGIEERIGAPEFLTDYSGLTEEGAYFLVEKGVRLVGTDAAGIDHPEASTCPAHQVLLPENILVVENLANLKGLAEACPAMRFRLICLPLKIKGATGSPVRAVAIVEE